DRFPNSIGGKLCRNLVSEIEAKSFSINTERVWNCFPDAGSLFASSTENQEATAQQTCASINITYRNVTKVYFRAVAQDWEALIKAGRFGPENFSEPERRALLTTKPALEWNEALPDSG